MDKGCDIDVCALQRACVLLDLDHDHDHHDHMDRELTQAQKLLAHACQSPEIARAVFWQCFCCRHLAAMKRVVDIAFADDKDIASVACDVVTRACEENNILVLEWALSKWPALIKEKMGGIEKWKWLFFVHVKTDCWTWPGC